MQSNEQHSTSSSVQNKTSYIATSVDLQCSYPQGVGIEGR